MAVTSGFFNSLNGDRRYNAEQMSEIFNGIINDGVFSSVGTAFAVTASEGNTVTIGIGRGWFNSAWIYNDAILPLTLSNSETLLNRIDAVVIEINHSIGVRSGSIKVVNGTPATTPENPTLANIDDVHQYPLAYIYRAAGSTSIVQANITNKVGTSDCPYVTGILEVQNIDNIVAQWQSEFDIWFANLEDSLSGDVAVKLANDILALQSQFEDLALYKTVYVELEDSQDNTIQDSNGNPIYGATTFGDSNTEGGSSGQPVVVSESQYKPGDTLTTARNDLDESWLLCNGAEITRTDYPQLAAQFPPKPTDPYEHSTPNSYPVDTAIYDREDNPTFVNIVYNNGLYVAAGVRFVDNGSGWYNIQRGIFYTSDLSGTWSFVDLTSSITLIYKLKYINGYYVIAGTGVGGSGNNSYTGRILFATTPSGPWSTKDLWISSETTRNETSMLTHCYDIDFGGGYFVAVGDRCYDTTDQYTVEAAMFYSTSLGGTWTELFMDVDYGSQWDFRTVNYDSTHNEFVVTGYYQTESYASAISVPATSMSSGSWTSRNIGDSNYRVIYVNGYYVYIAYSSSSARSFYTTKLPSSSDFSGSRITFTAPFNVAEIVYDSTNEYYVCFGDQNNDRATVAYSESLNGPWTISEPFDFIISGVNDTSSYAELTDGLIVNGQYIGVGRILNISNDNTEGYIAPLVVYSNDEVFTLPSISLSDKTYTYIKAKED